jgi:hypothetical protein
MKSMSAFVWDTIITINAPVFYGAGSYGFLAGNMHYEGKAYFPPEIHYFPLHKKTGALVILCT